MQMNLPTYKVLSTRESGRVVNVKWRTLLTTPRLLNKETTAPEYDEPILREQGGSFTKLCSGYPRYDEINV